MVKKILMKSKEVIPLFIHPYNEHMVHARYCFGFCSYKNKRDNLDTPHKLYTY